jgi:hypothetical protein
MKERSGLLATAALAVGLALAVAPTVGVYADGSVAITPALSNGQTATAVALRDAL